MKSIVVSLLLIALFGCAKEAAPEAQLSARAQHPELAFFNSLSGELAIELSAPTERIGNTANERAVPGSKINSLKLTAEVFNDATASARPLTPEELQSVAFRGAQIKLRGEGGVAVEHRAPDGTRFTVQELLNAVEETERQTRDKSEWFEGVDVHHTFFEGIEESDDGVWDISWGS